jgi:hypothetical protein
MLNVDFVISSYIMLYYDPHYLFDMNATLRWKMNMIQIVIRCDWNV